MFDFNQYKEALLNNNDEFGIFSHYHLTGYAETCEWECKRKFSEYRQWEKQNKEKLNFYLKADDVHDAFIDAAIRVKEILEDNSYKYGWFLYLNNIPADEIEMLPIDKFSNLPGFTDSSMRFETLKNQILLSAKSEDDKQTILKFFKFKSEYEMFLLQLLTHLGYYHCHSTQCDIKKVKDFYKKF